ncbi:MAG: tetratricopeptide repeat protein [Massilia sp.]
MKTLMAWLLFLFVLLISGCAGVPAPVPTQLFSDAAFGPPSEAVAVDNLFSMSPAMLGYLNSKAFKEQVRDKGPERGLVDALYQKSDLRLEYDSSVTRDAAQTYQARTGNCMSLVIMTAAFAKAMALNVTFQSVVVDDTWRRSGNLYLASGHVNLTLAKRPAVGVTSSDGDRSLLIDFLPQEDMAGYRTTVLDEDTVVAMYMNNRAVEALVRNEVNNAYWWAKSALEKSPSFVLAYNTLAVIYQRNGHELLAERAYRLALEREPKNIVLMQNFAPLLASLGKHDEAKAMAQRVAAMQPNPPYHYFNLGMEAMARQDYASAKALFAREVQRAPYSDEFHFWLGVALLRLGDAKQAREQIALALDNSTSKDGKALYSAKLAHLKAQARQAY